MLEITLTGKLPRVKSDFSDEMREIADLLWDSVKTNFLEGGRPARWARLSTGEPAHLIRSGKLYGRIHQRSGKDFAEVFVRDPEPYMFAHQHGATTHPTVTERSKKFFWHMWFETGNEMWKAMALTKIGTKFSVVIQQRKYMMFQEEDLKQIEKILGSSVFETHESS